MVRPEQSKLSGPAAPYTYGSPIFDRAVATAAPAPEPTGGGGPVGALAPGPLLGRAFARAARSPWTRRAASACLRAWSWAIRVASSPFTLLSRACWEATALSMSRFWAASLSAADLAASALADSRA